MNPKIPPLHRAIALVCLAAAVMFVPPAKSDPRLKRDDSLALISLDIPSTSFVLPNGLTVIVHEDHSAPLVAVNLWYHVGSKNEPSGKSGFAHLFEHLMFNGSEHFNDDFFKATQKIGATEQNGTTDVDRTNYYQTVPKAALDSILWLESDRMGHLLGAIDQAKLDEQRAVVKNERRQRVENMPYGRVQDLIIRATMPFGHPYAHSTIGSMADLDAASLEEVSEWFRSYYGPSNTVLVLAGDITPEEAKAKVEKFFAHIPPGTPVSQPTRWTVKGTGTVRETAYDRVAQARLYRVWNVSEFASVDTDYLQFLALVLAGDKNARLLKRLVISDQLATDVSVEVWKRELGGQFTISVTLKPGSDMGEVERIVDEELQRVLADGPTPEEMGRLRTSTIASLVRSLESIAGKANLLAESQTYLGSPGAWKEGFDRFRWATPAQLQAAGRTWLSNGDYVLHLLPFGNLTASGTDTNRSAMPMPTFVAPAKFPAYERTTLDNGMTLLVARHDGVPLISMTLLLETGTQTNFAAISPGTGPLAMSLLEEGTTHLDGEQLVEALGELGATLQTGGGGETSYASLSALKPVLRPSLELLADVVLRPAFDQDNFDRLKAQMLASIASAKQDPDRAANRLLPTLLFGPDHAYGRLVTEAAVQSIKRDDMTAFHARWFHPNNATLVVAGDTDLAEIRPIVEAAFAGWKHGDVPDTLAPLSEGPQTPVVYLIDKPGTQQTVIYAALVAPPRKQGDAIARSALNMVLGGSFTSRLNMKLREEKGWAYGAGSGIEGGLGSQVFSAGASVQADKTAESMTEIATLLGEVAKTRPLDATELATARDNMSLGLTSAWASSAGIAQYLLDQQVYGLPENYYQRYPHNVAVVSLGAVNAEAEALIGVRPLTWVVAGDRAKIEAGIRGLALGKLQVIDVDGRLMQ